MPGRVRDQGMQAANVREHFAATGAWLLGSLLTRIHSRNWEMGDEDSLGGGSSSAEGSRSRCLHISKPSMKSEEKRLRTFHCWPEDAPVFPADLAAAGFFFIGPDDRVECFCCGGALYDWFAEDDPLEEHKRFFPTCPFIQGWDVGNRQMTHDGEIQDCVDGQFLGMLQSLDVEEATVDGQAEYPDMERENDRLMTFEIWPSYARVSPELLARAGFFYTGQGDYVRCFYCDGALRNWEAGDDPWVEHARWFPRCKFLLESRGRDFINSIQENYFSSPVPPESHLYQPEERPGSPQGSSHLTSMVQSALQMGFSPNLVTSLVQNKYQQTGASYPSTSELVLDLLRAVQDQGSQAEDTRGPVQPSDPCRVRREAATEHPSDPGPALTVEEELQRLRDERMCKVCMDKDVSVVLVPCGHLVVCAECAPNLRRCPICRGVIRDSMKAFLS
ncbi:baculoviral IAP repeat-containing protein 7 isoform X2 [Hemicordylus capensis]|uniref:baculoviral IAP repeat-containing protein 7 isoform X2 n=1 Tax=Hemicordylus capensis TaxID=884348 RepID=UPI00230379DE|nr:baculoviral IAP repeat-containing protein 7 isoform X2 [Hemicordylus capensis]